MCKDGQNIIIFIFWTMKSLEEEEKSFEWFLPFNKISTVSWLILLSFQARTIPMIRENGDFLAVILGLFLPFVLLKYWRLSGALPQHSRARLRHSQPQKLQCILICCLSSLHQGKNSIFQLKKGHSSWPLPPSHYWFLTTFVYLVVSRHISTI